MPDDILYFRESKDCEEEDNVEDDEIPSFIGTPRFPMERFEPAYQDRIRPIHTGSSSDSRKSIHRPRFPDDDALLQPL